MTLAQHISQTHGVPQDVAERCDRLAAEITDELSLRIKQRIEDLPDAEVFLTYLILGFYLERVQRDSSMLAKIGCMMNFEGFRA